MSNFWNLPKPSRQTTACFTLWGFISQTWQRSCFFSILKLNSQWQAEVSVSLRVGMWTCLNDLITLICSQSLSLHCHLLSELKKTFFVLQITEHSVRCVSHFTAEWDFYESFKNPLKPICSPLSRADTIAHKSPPVTQLCSFYPLFNNQTNHSECPVPSPPFCPPPPPPLFITVPFIQSSVLFSGFSTAPGHQRTHSSFSHCLSPFLPASHHPWSNHRTTHSLISSDVW